MDWSVCLPLYAGGVCWTLVYDTIYAHQVRGSGLWPVVDINIMYLKDRPDDLNVGIRSTAILFGENTRPILAGLSASSISLITYAGLLNSQGIPFYMGSALAALQLARVVWKTDFNDRQSCWKGFVGCGWAGFWLWTGAMCDYITIII